MARLAERGLARCSTVKDMEKTISIEEILGTLNDGTVQICATAEGAYDDEEERIAITLDAFACPSSPTEDGGTRLPEIWLPKGERVGEHLPYAEVDPFVREVFHRWVEKVRASIPRELSLRP
jgi:hypothetical protein